MQTCKAVGIVGAPDIMCPRLGWKVYPGVPSSGVKSSVEATAQMLGKRPLEAPPYVWLEKSPKSTLKSAIIWGSNPLFRTGMGHVIHVTQQNVRKKVLGMGLSIHILDPCTLYYKLCVCKLKI
jgi:hypothetical protein